jgi:hypothetical protein
MNASHLLLLSVAHVMRWQHRPNLGYADHPRKRPERGLRGRSHAGLSAWSAGRLVDRDLQRHPSAPYPPESRKAERYATDPDYRLSLVKPKVWESRRL